MCSLIFIRLILVLIVPIQNIIYCKDLFIMFCHNFMSDINCILVVWLTGLDNTISGVMANGYRPSTSRTYKSAQQAYLQFCNLFGFIALPATEQVLLRFMAYKALSVGYQSFTVYLSAIKALHDLHGYQCPSMSSPRINLFIRGLKNNAPPPRKKSPLTYQMLSDIKGYLSHSFTDMTVWTCMTVAFFGCLRAAEVCATDCIDELYVPKVSDVYFGTDRNGVHFMSVTVRRTKTEPHGIDCIIGCSGTDICAYCAMVAYLRARGIYNCADHSGFLFVLADGAVLTKSFLVASMRTLLHLAGYEAQSFTGHSFRVGSATQGYDNGLSEHDIKSLGHWKSSTYHRYIHTPVSHLTTYAACLAGNSIYQ